MPLPRRHVLALTAACAATPTLARAARKPAPAIGVCTSDLEPAKRAGFDFAELPVKALAAMTDAEFSTFAERHAKVGLPTPVGNLFLPAELKVVGPAVDLSAVQAHARRAFTRARKLGLSIVVFGSGGARKAPEGFSRDEAFAQLVTVGKKLAPEAAAHGITLAVEPLRRGETNTVSSLAEGLAWARAVGHPSFQVMVDLYHLAEEKEDPVILVEAGARLRHVHIANPNGRRFPMDAAEHDYAPFFARLRQIRYRGRISVEGKTDAFDQDGPRALRFLRGAVAKL